MHRWTLTVLLSVTAGIAAWLAPTALAPAPTGPSPLAGPARDPAPPFAALATSDGPLELRVAVDQRAIPAQAVSRRYLVATISAGAATGAARLPVDLALVMDTSGSMSGSGKISEARRAAEGLVDALGPEDAFSLIRFDDRAEVIQPLGHHPKDLLRLAIADLRPDGGTNLSEGLLAAFDETRRGAGSVRKVILMTDGQANQGVTSPEALARLADHAGVTVSTIGVGLDFNESLLASMADSGHGRYRYVGVGTDLTAAYAEELDAAAHLVASGTRLQVEFAEGVLPQRVFQWAADLQPHRACIAIGDLAAGQTRTVVIEVDVTPGAAADQPLAQFSLDGAAIPDRGAFREMAAVDATVVAPGTDLAPYVDRDAMTVSTRAVAGWSALQANAAYQQGDGERGRDLLRSANTYLKEQQRTFGLAIPEATSESLEALGYLDDASAQKGAYSAARSMGRSE